MQEASPSSAVVSAAAKATVPTSMTVASTGWLGIPLDHWQIYLGMFGVIVFVICTIVDSITKRKQVNVDERRLKLLENREERDELKEDDGRSEK